MYIMLYLQMLLIKLHLASTLEFALGVFPMAVPGILHLLVDKDLQ